MKYLQIEFKRTHWSIIEELLLEELTNSLSQKDSFDVTNLLSLYNHIVQSETGKKEFRNWSIITVCVKDD